MVRNGNKAMVVPVVESGRVCWHSWNGSRASFKKNAAINCISSTLVIICWFVNIVVNIRVW